MDSKGKKRIGFRPMRQQFCEGVWELLCIIIQESAIQEKPLRKLFGSTPAIYRTFIEIFREGRSNTKNIKAANRNTDQGGTNKKGDLRIWLRWGTSHTFGWLGIQSANSRTVMTGTNDARLTTPKESLWASRSLGFCSSKCMRQEQLREHVFAFKNNEESPDFRNNNQHKGSVGSKLIYANRKKESTHWLEHLHN